MVQMIAVNQAMDLDFRQYQIASSVLLEWSKLFICITFRHSGQQSACPSRFDLGNAGE